jgi:four helix bundle protein
LLKLGASGANEAAFICKLSDSESETAETQVWIEFAEKCGYLQPDQAGALFEVYDEVLRMIVAMINRPKNWVISAK